MNEIYDLHNETVGSKVVENLKKNDFQPFILKLAKRHQNL